MAGTGPVPQPPRTNKLPPMDAQKNQQTDEILNAILPPRYSSLILFTNSNYFVPVQKQIIPK